MAASNMIITFNKKGYKYGKDIQWKTGNTPR